MLAGDLDFTQYIIASICVLTRISSLIVSAPFFSSKSMPIKIKTALVLLLTIIITPTISFGQLPDPLSITGFILLLQQIIIGVTIGLIFQFLFHISIVGGQIVAMQSGLGFASFVDPTNHENLPIISEFYLIITLLLFLISNGHILLISIIHKSFALLPISSMAHFNLTFVEIVTYFGNIFSGALAIAIPTIIALLIVNITLAVMTKSAPQLNIFTIGFPLMLIIGLFIMYANFSEFVTQTEYVLATGYQDTLELIGSSHG